MQSQTIATKPLRMTYEEYLAWKDEETHAEWDNGEVIVFIPTKREHKDVIQFLHVLIELFLRVTGLGSVHLMPFEVFLPKAGASREPDLFFVSTANESRLSRNRMEGAPDLVVEVVSEDSVERDYITKFRQYELEGVLGYWILDARPGVRQAQFYVLEEGQLIQRPLDENGWYTSKVLVGFRFQVGWLWQEPMPDALEVLQQILTPEQKQILANKLGLS